MPVTAKPAPRLSFSQKLLRLRERLHDPQWRKYGIALLAGKGLGIGLVLVAITLASHVFFGKVYAADPEVKAADVVNPLNTVWTLVAAFLVFGMQVGFTMLEAGFSASGEPVT